MPSEILGGLNYDIILYFLYIAPLIPQRSQIR